MSRHLLICTLGASWAVIPEVYGFLAPDRLPLYRHHPDADGLARDLGRLRPGDRPVLVPAFDRAMDLARAAAEEVPATAQVVLVEGNWLLLDAPPWSDLAPLFDLTAMLQVPETVLVQRLIARWLAHDHDLTAARARALGNDLPNARRVVEGSRPADLVLAPGPLPEMNRAGFTGGSNS